jgi:hypothetical protein
LGVFLRLLPTAKLTDGGGIVPSNLYAALCTYSSLRCRA